MTTGPTVAMLAWLPATTAPIMARIAATETNGSAGSSMRTTRDANWLSNRPAATGNATICMMLSSMPPTAKARPTIRLRMNDWLNTSCAVF